MRDLPELLAPDCDELPDEEDLDVLPELTRDPPLLLEIDGLLLPDDGLETDGAERWGEGRATLPDDVLAGRETGAL